MEFALQGGKPKSGKQFLDFDGKVLRFFSCFEGFPVVILYFLADDTINIQEVHTQNDGRDKFPQLLRRQKVAKNFKGVPQPGQEPLAEEIYKYEDFYVFNFYL